MEEKQDLVRYLREEDIFLKDPHTKKAKHVSIGSEGSEKMGFGVRKLWERFRKLVQRDLGALQG